MEERGKEKWHVGDEDREREGVRPRGSETKREGERRHRKRE